MVAQVKTFKPELSREYPDDVLGVKCPNCYAQPGQHCLRTRFPKGSTAKQRENMVARSGRVLDRPHVEREISAHRQAHPEMYDDRSLYERLTGHRLSATTGKGNTNPVTVTHKQERRTGPTPEECKSVKCPHCGAKKGKPCKTSSGSEMAWDSFHAKRRRYVEEHNKARRTA